MRTCSMDMYFELIIVEYGIEVNIDISFYLLRILPVGVVSKKDIGACIVFSNRDWWIFLEASAALNWQPI